MADRREVRGVNPRRLCLALQRGTRTCGGKPRWFEAATTPDTVAKLLAKHGLGPRPHLRDQVQPVSSASHSLARERATG
jgi:hypothetical protein